MYWTLLILFCSLILLTRWVTRHVQGIGYLLTGDGQVALVLYFLLIFPGVAVHEVSHALTAWVLRVKVRHLSLGIRRKPGGNLVSLGSVDIAGADPLRASLIGLAPLVFGCAVILLISSRVFGLQLATTFSLERLWRELGEIHLVPDFWLWVYLVLAVGNAMFPSAADRRSWGLALVFISFVGIVLYFAGLLDTVSVSLGRWVSGWVHRLTHAFSIAVAADLVFVAVLFLTEQTLALLGFGRLKYR